VAQTLAANGFVLGSIVVPQTIHVRPDGQTYRLEFTNQPLSTLIIRKIDSYDNSPIQGARYRVYRQDNALPTAVSIATPPSVMLPLVTSPHSRQCTRQTHE
jgi:hypothetical protein